MSRFWHWARTLLGGERLAGTRTWSNTSCVDLGELAFNVCSCVAGAVRTVDCCRGSHGRIGSKLEYLRLSTHRQVGLDRCKRGHQRCSAEGRETCRNQVGVVGGQWQAAASSVYSDVDAGTSSLLCSARGTSRARGSVRRARLGKQAGDWRGRRVSMRVNAWRARESTSSWLGRLDGELCTARLAA